jgi:hypothetical protein
MLLTEIDQYHDLSFYTLEHPDKEFFIHQLIVDAYTAQHADDNTKPIALSFALIGLYLFAERNYTGKQIQLAHMELARTKRNWPFFELPLERGNITVNEVLATTAGIERDDMIKAWSRDVWQAFQQHRDLVAALASSY